jgi:hypothetical protein
MSSGPSYKARLEDVGHETGSSYSDVCVIDGHAVSSAKVGIVTTQSVLAPFSNVGDIAITTSGIEADIFVSGLG